MRIDGGDNLAKVLKYYGMYQPGMPEYKMLCPFHGDVNESMKVNIARGDFYCFGCGATGVAYDFVRLANPKMNDLEALLEYSRVIKSKKVRKLKGVSKKLKAKNNKKLTKKAKEHYDGLPQTNWKEVYKGHYLFKRGYTPKVLKDNGVKINTSYNYPIISPMYDNGVFKGTVCRTSNKRVEQERKYLYNEGFDRQNTLVGNYSKPWVIITEGYYDWLKLRQFLKRTEWYDNCVAVLGWRITPEQAKNILQHTDRVISALDNTGTGEKGTNVLKEYFRYVVRFQFDELEKDIGELTKTRFNKMWLDTLDIIENKTYKKCKTVKGGNKNGKRKRRKSS